MTSESPGSNLIDSRRKFCFGKQADGKTLRRKRCSNFGAAEQQGRMMAGIDELGLAFLVHDAQKDGRVMLRFRPRPDVLIEVIDQKVSDPASV